MGPGMSNRVRQLSKQNLGSQMLCKLKAIYINIFIPCFVFSKYLSFRLKRDGFAAEFMQTDSVVQRVRGMEGRPFQLMPLSVHLPDTILRSRFSS